MMKNFIIAFLVVFIASPAMALSVVNSPHDMVFSGFATDSANLNEVCIYCHTPHGAVTSASQVPLWNNTPAATVDATVYTSATIDFAFNDASINLTDARMCLSCHDSGVGVLVNLPNVGIIDTTVVPSVMDANALIGTNLSNDHPIGMNLTANPEAIDRNDHDPLNSAAIKTIAQITGATGFNSPASKIFFNGASNTMWCSTCHDVHSNDFPPFLRMSNDGSAMCKACHIK